MKLETSERHLEIVSDNTGIKFDIDDSSKDFIMSILREKLYSNPIKAVVRELICNAKDAHVEAGIEDKPIEITLPTKEDNTFYVRDYGQGISPDRIENIFVKYGVSSKRDSNEEIGGFGLGAKSPFAISDMFTIETYNQGTRYIYSAYLDKKGSGEIVCLLSEPTNETGTLIKVPIKKGTEDHYVKELICLTSYWKVKPKTNIDDTPQILEVNVGDVVLEGSNWSIRNKYRPNSFILIGEIPYSVDVQQCHLRNKLSVYNLDITIEVNIGDLSIAANREALHYDTRTVNKLIELNNSISAEIKEEVQRKVSECPNLIEALYLFNNLGAEVKELVGLIKYKDTILPKGNCYPIKITDNDLSLDLYKKTDYQKRCDITRRSTEIYLNSPYRRTLVVNDLNKKINSSDLGRYLSRGIYVLEMLNNKYTYETLLEKYPIFNADNLNFLRLSDLVQERIKKQRKIIERNKNKSEITLYKYVKGTHRNAPGIYRLLQQVKVDKNIKGVFITLEGKEKRLRGFRLVDKEELDIFRYLFQEDIYVIPISREEELTALGWRNLDNLVEDKYIESLSFILKDFLTSNSPEEVIRLAKDVVILNDYRHHWRSYIPENYRAYMYTAPFITISFFDLLDQIECKELVKVIKLLKETNDIYKEKGMLLQMLRDLIDINKQEYQTPSYLLDLVKQMYHKYPLLKYLQDRPNEDIHKAGHIIKYINLVHNHEQS